MLIISSFTRNLNSCGVGYRPGFIYIIMKVIGLLLLGIVQYNYAATIPRPKAGAEIEDTWMEPIDILKKYGYPAESHTVQTDDGYLLTMFRIPYGRMCSADKSKGPVLVQHGLFSSAVDWFIAGTEHGLAYILADHCYDVWLANSRGNSFSRAHTSLDVKDPEFWDFSWHEMGVYDTPAEIDYILHVTGWKDLLYIGHSQGTTQFFIFNSLHPEYVDKVRAGFMLAPIAFMGNCESGLLAEIAKFAGVIGWIAENLGIDEFLPHNDFITAVGGNICSDLHPDLEEICTNIIFIGCGFDSEQMNTTMIPIYLGHLPAGAATKQLLHYAQSLNSGKFRQFDYGLLGNLKHYGKAEPPEYDLSQGKIPTILHYSSNDLLAAVADVDILAKKLGNLEGKFLVPFEKFNHLDYIIAIDVVELLYDRLIDLMNRF